LTVVAVDVDTVSEAGSLTTARPVPARPGGGRGGPAP
jgi:hypothetical protein